VNLDVVLLPRLLEPHHLARRTVVVFDVLRATTTMAAALAAGVSEIRVFASLHEASRAAAADSSRILCGEEQCLPPAGFDLGNSPGAFRRELHGGRTAYMSTTNGTRAIVAARDAATVLTGALVNASAVARAAAAAGADVTLLCAGTGGAVALEDLIGAGAVMASLGRLVSVELQSDPALVARDLYRARGQDLRAALAEAVGGRNVIAAGLAPDIDFAAHVDALDVVGRVDGSTLTVRDAATR
jgi:2-phosphosulfolactate phosphatase